MMPPAAAPYSASLDGICAYFTRFPLSFPLRRLADAWGGEWVLDPFCGCGAVLFAARMRGLGAVGVDANPVAAAIAEAKLADVSAQSVLRRAATLFPSLPEPAHIPQGAFWRLCFDPITLRLLCSYRENAAPAMHSPEDLVLRALLLGLLHGPRRGQRGLGYLSNDMPTSFSPHPAGAVAQWQRHQLYPEPRDLSLLLHQQASLLLNNIPPAVPGFVRHGDCRRIPWKGLEARFSWVIASPPYFGHAAFEEDQWLRRWLLGGPPAPEPGSNNQLQHDNEDAYVAGLAAAWQAVAAVCLPGAKMFLRVGALPGAASRAPEAMLRASLSSSGAPWRVEAVVKTTDRQNASARKAASPFASPAPRPLYELELTARFTP